MESSALHLSPTTASPVAQECAQPKFSLARSVSPSQSSLQSFSTEEPAGATTTMLLSDAQSLSSSRNALSVEPLSPAIEALGKCVVWPNRLLIAGFGCIGRVGFCRCMHICIGIFLGLFVLFLNC